MQILDKLQFVKDTGIEPASFFYIMAEVSKDKKLFVEILS